MRTGLYAGEQFENEPLIAGERRVGLLIAAERAGTDIQIEARSLVGRHERGANELPTMPDMALAIENSGYEQSAEFFGPEAVEDDAAFLALHTADHTVAIVLQDAIGGGAGGIGQGNEI